MWCGQSAILVCTPVDTPARLALCALERRHREAGAVHVDLNPMMCMCVRAGVRQRVCVRARESDVARDREVT